MPKDNSYDDVKNSLFEDLLRLRSNTPAYQAMWILFEQTIKVHLQEGSLPFFDHCLHRLKTELQLIIQENSNYDIETFNRYTTIVKSFV